MVKGCWYVTGGADEQVYECPTYGWKYHHWSRKIWFWEIRLYKRKDYTHTHTYRGYIVGPCIMSERDWGTDPYDTCPRKPLLFFTWIFWP